MKNFLVLFLLITLVLIVSFTARADLTEIFWEQIVTSTLPTTLAGYGITNGLTVTESYAISSFTATALQTTFTPNWNPVTSNTVEVFFGGNQQRLSHDYTVTVGGDVVVVGTGLATDTPVVIQRR